MKFRLLSIALLTTSLFADDSSVLVTGLLNPIRIALTPSGNLLVGENDKTPNSGRISIVTQGGNRRTLIDGLPSGLSAPNNEPDGVTSFLLQGRTLYITLGEGDVLRNGTKQGTNIVNPDGVSSALFSSIIKMTLSTDLDAFSGNLTLKAENQAALADGNTVELKGTAGDVATLEVLANFPDVTPDANTIFRNAHTFGLTTVPTIPDTFFVIDAGQNTVLQVNSTTGRSKVLTRFAPLKTVVPGPPFSDVVPDSIHVYGNSLLITQLTGFPFTPGQSRAVLVNPATGESSVFIAGLNSAIDTAIRTTNARPQFWVLEHSTNLLAGAKGRLIRYDSADGVVVLNDLNGPTSMVLDQASNQMFITEINTGTIRTYKLN